MRAGILVLALVVCLTGQIRAVHEDADTVVLLQDPPAEAGLEGDEDQSGSEKKEEQMKQQKADSTEDIKGQEEKAEEEMKEPVGTIGLDQLKAGLSQLNQDMVGLKAALPPMTKDKKNELNAKIAKEEKKAGLPAEVTAEKDTKGGGGINIQAEYAKTARDLGLLRSELAKQYKDKGALPEELKPPQADGFEDMAAKLGMDKTQVSEETNLAKAEEKTAEDEEKSAEAQEKKVDVAEKEAMTGAEKAGAEKAAEHAAKEDAAEVTTKAADKTASAESVAKAQQKIAKQDAEADQEANEPTQEQENEMAKQSVDLSAYTGPAPARE